MIRTLILVSGAIQLHSPSSESTSADGAPGCMALRLAKTARNGASRDGSALPCRRQIVLLT
eukprot:3682778-Amphidinium_carterae.2